MDKKDIISRLQELYIYDLYGFKTELKPLALILLVDETINCVATAILDGKRRFVCITDYRIIILFTPVVGTGESTIIKRKAVVDFEANKKILNSSFKITTDEKEYIFRNTQRRIIDLFLWAMKQPIKEYEE
ncbi:MAG: hypothetical protein OWP43_01370 [Sphaerochaetaceae bacterium]|nr:hypothetical protein [Sphaerochaetaceae bacterium]